MSDDVLSVDASPTKGLIIDILTRDIAITAAIMELVDNSIDSANSLSKSGDLSPYSIAITANASEFSIEDNCAGIGVDNAAKYVFRMGRPPKTPGTAGSVGQFGVGMKRALFKLGSAFTVESNTADDSFTVDVDVTKWMRDDEDWTLPLVAHEDVPDSPGTTIIVTNLHEEVRSSFERTDFLDELQSELRSRHRLAIGNGLSIKLNENPVIAEDSVVAASDLIKPATRTFTLQTRHGDLHARIIVGVATTDPSAVSEDAEPEAQSYPAADAGWLVFGNGRLLLANDKTRLTGWGSGKKKVPQYHNQYARFRGFVYLDATNPAAIPWNTTKTSIDPDSTIWEQVLQQMIDAARGVIDMLNLAKLERQMATGDMATPILDAIRASSPIDAIGALGGVHFSMTMTELWEGGSTDAVYPDPNPELIESWKKIQYSVLAKTFEELAEAIGNANAAEIGRISFEAFYSATMGD